MLDLLNEDLARARRTSRRARPRPPAPRRRCSGSSSLAAELLDLSRIDAGIPLRTELVEVGAVAALGHRRARGARSASAAARSTSTAARRLGASAIPGSVAQIVRILLDNALAPRRRRASAIRVEP